MNQSCLKTKLNFKSRASAHFVLFGLSVLVAQGNAWGECHKYQCNIVEELDPDRVDTAVQEQVRGSSGGNSSKSPNDSSGGGGPGTANPHGNHYAQKQKALREKCNDSKKMEQAQKTAATSAKSLEEGNKTTPQNLWQKLRSSFSSLKNLGNSFKNFLTKSFLGHKGSSGGGIKGLAARVAQPIVDLLKPKESSAVKEAWEAACTHQGLRDQWQEWNYETEFNYGALKLDDDIKEICQATCAENNKVVTFLTNAVNSFTGATIHRKFTIRRVPGNPTISGNGRLDCNCRPAREESQG